jgi:hypothetical protein
MGAGVSFFMVESRLKKPRKLCLERSAVGGKRKGQSSAWLQ